MRFKRWLFAFIGLLGLAGCRVDEAAGTAGPPWLRLMARPN
jgi:hypothetical protein